MKKKSWKSKLTKKELKHVAATTDNSLLREFKANLKFQAKKRIEFPNIEPCWECRRIANKLGFEI